MQQQPSNPFTVYTDGSYCHRTKTGAWAYLIMAGERQVGTGTGSMTAEGSHVLELMAALQALRATPAGYAVVVKTDNQALVEGMTLHLERWRRTDWRRVSDAILWQQIAHEAALRHVSWKHVRGHVTLTRGGNRFNAQADAMAGARMKQQRRVLRRGA